ARRSGEDKEAAYYDMFHGTAHVVLASGLTIAGATLTPPRSADRFLAMLAILAIPTNLMGKR
ncbi:MMPL family transporter, partial [Mycolicibacterium farcinogenes]|nr:MMPL family transporter [Mycolicibacterium farcinogenes]